MNHRIKKSNKKLDKLSFLLSEIILKTLSEGKLACNMKKDSSKRMILNEECKRK